MERLPPDVMHSILGLVPTPQRLAFASLVCKRWRAAAIAATTSLTDPADLEGAAGVLTALRRLKLSSSTLAISSSDIFPHLRSLSLRHPLLMAAFGNTEGDVRANEASLQRLLAQRTTLTQLKVRDPAGPQWLGLLRASVPSLTSLAFMCSHRADHSAFTLDFPRLTSLSITVYYHSEPAASLIASIKGLLERTHTRLESLEIRIHDSRVTPLWAEIEPLTFPHVRRLSVNSDSAFHPALPSLPARCHPSVTVALSCQQNALKETAETPSLATALTALTLNESLMPSAPLFQTLSAFTRLASLSLVLRRRCIIIGPLSQSPFSALITRLHAATCAHLSELRPLTRLRHLTIDTALDLGVDAPPLPAVHALVLRQTRTLTELRVCLSHFPCLRSLAATMSDGCPLDELEQLVRAHATLEHVVITDAARGEKTALVRVFPTVTLVVK